MSGTSGGGPPRIVDLGMIGVAVSWGMNHVILKHTLGNMQPLALNSVRLSVGSVVLLSMLWLIERDLRVQPSDLKWFIATGLVGHTLYQYLFIQGLNLTLAGKTSVILATMPAFVAFITQYMGRESYTMRAWSGIMISLAGVLLVTTGGRGVDMAQGTLAGDLLIVGATLCWSLYTVLMKPLLGGYSVLKATALTMAMGTGPLVLLSVPALQRQDWVSVTPLSWGALSFSALVPISLGYILWSWGVKRIGSARTAVYQNISPVIASIGGLMFLGERWVLVQMLGAILIVAGVTQVRSGVRPAPAVRTGD
ncbi:MAG: EamA family transporter [Firmicutes bacterium]|nr:EamA family transporter [Bacillota bacterium]